MDKIELQIKQDESTVKDIAEKIELASHTIFAIKESFLQKLIVKEAVKTEMINVAGQMFIQYERELDESNQIMKSYEKYIGDDEYKHDALNKIFENNFKENKNSEKDEINKGKSINSFTKL